MRFLKRKIALASAARLANQDQALVKIDIKLENQEQITDDTASVSDLSLSNKDSSHIRPQKRNRNRIPGLSFTPETYRATKNIVKNYAQAIFKFTLSSIATSYLVEIVKKEDVDLYDFLKYVSSNKNRAVSLCNFRSVLLVTQTDDEEIARYKKVLREISEVFIKFFSVNWIFHSKIAHKDVYLTYRFKMLRRVRNPELFTHLKN